MNIGCVVMAAGNSKRFAANKLSADFSGRPLIRWALEAVPAGLQTVVVTQYPEIAALAESYGFRCLINKHPDRGQGYTIRLGTACLQGCDGILYMVADQPMLRRRSAQAVIELWRQHPEHIVCLSHKGKRGNPCIFPAACFAELMALEGDVGGNVVIRRHADKLLLVEAPEDELSDVDTPQALAFLQQRADQ